MADTDDIVDDGDAPTDGDELIADPAAFLSFVSHNDALGALHAVGFRKAQSVHDFSSSALVTAVNDLVGPRGITCLDLTSTIPKTASAAYKALTVCAFSAVSSCRKDNNVAFVVQRTVENTPSFLFGVHWQSVQFYGPGEGDKRAVSEPAPAAFVFFRDRQIVIPSSACSTDEVLAARAVAFQITQDSAFAEAATEPPSQTSRGACP